MVQDQIMRDPTSLTSGEDLYQFLRRTFQNQDPGLEAWRDFHTLRMNRSKYALEFGKRLVQLSYVVNTSSSPLCRALDEHDISTRVQHGLPRYCKARSRISGIT